MNSDFKDLLSLFNASRVRYLVVGGYALMKYTEPRYTKDLDVWIEANPKNARLVFRCLRTFGAPLQGMIEPDFAKEGFCYQMGRPPARIDILMSIDGVKFTDAWSKRVITDFDGVPASVISRNDLIANKRAVGRPQDLIDADSLAAAGESVTEQPRRRSSHRRKKPDGRSRG
jgi:hypothetical protein